MLIAYSFLFCVKRFSNDLLKIFTAPPFFPDPSSRLRPTPRKISLNNWIVVESITFKFLILNPFNRLSEIKQ
jgi:hypothetical protein